MAAAVVVVGFVPVVLVAVVGITISPTLSLCGGACGN